MRKEGVLLRGFLAGCEPPFHEGSPMSRASRHREPDGLLIVRDMLRRYAQGHIPDSDEQDDFVQTVLIKAWSRRGQFRGAAKFTTWVYQIARNELNTILRQRYRRSRALAGLRVLDLAHSPMPLDEQVINRVAAEGFVANLPAEVRAVFQLGVTEELTSAEVGRRLGLKPASVRSRFFRARRKLAHLELLAADGNVPLLAGESVPLGERQ